MAYTVDIEFNLNECEHYQETIETILNDVQDASGSERRDMIRSIEQNIESARNYIEQAELDLSGVGDFGTRDRLSQRIEGNKDMLADLEARAKDAKQQAQLADQAVAQGLTPDDLMNRTTAIQKQSERALDGALTALDGAEHQGNASLIEMQRQREVLGKASEQMNEMDSELARARKILKVMMTRAAGDNCVRVLALIVILAVVAVIIVEAVDGGAIKESVEGWFEGDAPVT